MTNVRRTGTYIAFHAEGKIDPTASDIKYFNLMKAWKSSKNSNFTFTDSHDKTGAIQDRSKRATIERHLKSRLLGSKNMVLIVTENTKKDTDWVPMEIAYAVDNCQIPIIVAYPNYTRISAPNELASMWPSALATRIRNNTASVIHVPFVESVLTTAIGQFSHLKLPSGGALGIYSAEAYRNWGLL